MLAEGQEPTDAELIAAALVPKDAQMVRFALANPETIVTRDLSYDDWAEVSSGESCFATEIAGEVALDEAWESWIAALTPHQAACFEQRFRHEKGNSAAGDALGRDRKSVDNAITLARKRIRSQAEKMLAERGLTIATATTDDLLALRFATYIDPREGGEL